MTTSPPPSYNAVNVTLYSLLIVLLVVCIPLSLLLGLLQRRCRPRRFDLATASVLALTAILTVAVSVLAGIAFANDIYYGIPSFAGAMSLFILQVAALATCAAIAFPNTWRIASVFANFIAGSHSKKKDTSDKTNVKKNTAFNEESARLAIASLACLAAAILLEAFSCFCLAIGSIEYDSYVFHTATLELLEGVLEALNGGRDNNTLAAALGRAALPLDFPDYETSYRIAGTYSFVTINYAIVLCVIYRILYLSPSHREKARAVETVCAAADTLIRYKGGAKNRGGKVRKKVRGAKELTIATRETCAEMGRSLEAAWSEEGKNAVGFAALLLPGNLATGALYLVSVAILLLMSGLYEWKTHRVTGWTECVE